MIAQGRPHRLVVVDLDHMEEFTATAPDPHAAVAQRCVEAGRDLGMDPFAVGLRPGLGLVCKAIRCI